MPTISESTNLIRNEAERLGFYFCGFSKAEFLELEASQLENWLRKENHGEMQYMENHFEKRLDPRKLVDGAQTVISLGYNYFSNQIQSDPSAPKISKYAYGIDYHLVIKEKLKLLFHFIQEKIGEVNGRMFVDSAPVMEKTWAKKSGLGWQGKNANLINKEKGSFFFLAELIVDLKLDYDQPIKDYCGTCTKCLDACPTDALHTPYEVDSKKCISYLTIELKNQIPEEFKGKMDNWMFGCDICQDVCPWNRFSVLHQETNFNPKQELLTNSKKDWESLNEEVFTKIFKNSAVKRTGFDGLTRTISFLKEG